jgi:hypothetical protein
MLFEDQLVQKEKGDLRAIRAWPGQLAILEKKAALEHKEFLAKMALRGSKD